jgi:hypothetical protein
MSIYLQYVDVAMLLPMMSSAMAKALKKFFARFVICDTYSVGTPLSSWRDNTSSLPSQKIKY